MSHRNGSERKSRERWVSLAVFVLVCLAVELVAGLLTDLSVRDWYLSLRRPIWTPPGWVFGPVWTFLYLSMAVAGWLVWQVRSVRYIRPALILFGIQLVLNALWSGLFFGLRNPMVAFWEILLLWFVIAVTLTMFWRIRRVSGLLFLPYLIWVTYATGLNFAIWRLNP
ncbi:MAG TPA: TspO/MBR family protein [Acidobacteriota bacterium]|nr:TspO/MBR family protein [Acidobacteriota bacterium]